MSAHDDEFPANERIHVMNVHRRACLDHLTPLEVAAFELIRACEIAGAHPLLTEAQALAMKAQDRLADWIDGGAPGGNHGSNGDFHWLVAPGEWNPMRFDPDYPRPWITKPSAEPAEAEATSEPAAKAKSWRILTQDASWITVSGAELRRDDDWIEIVGHGTRHCFFRPQSVEQIGQSA